MSGVPSAERSELGEKSYPKVEKLLRTEKRITLLLSLPLSSPLNPTGGRKLHPPTHSVILHYGWRVRRPSELLIRDVKESKKVSNE